MTQHTQQLASVLRRSIQAILSRGLADPRVRGLVSVTEVKVSDDGSNATVLVSVHPDEHADLSIKGLQHAAGHIRAELLRTLDMRRMPRLTFRIDESLKKQAQIHAAISRAVGDDHDETTPPADP